MIEEKYYIQRNNKIKIFPKQRKNRILEKEGLVKYYKYRETTHTCLDIS